MFLFLLIVLFYRYGGCNFICRGDQKVLKVRYADYPWHPKPFPQSLVDTPLGRSLKYKYHSIVGGVKEGEHAHALSLHPLIIIIITPCRHMHPIIPPSYHPTLSSIHPLVDPICHALLFQGICSALGTSDGGGGRVDGRGVIIASDAKTTPANTNTNTNANANSSEPSASSKTHNNTAGTIVKG